MRRRVARMHRQTAARDGGRPHGGQTVVHLRIAWPPLIAAGALLATIGPLDGVRAQNAFYEGFESSQVSWRAAGGDARYRIDFHGRVQTEAHIGSGSEHVRIVGTGGTQVLLAHEVGRARVIDELHPTLWIKSDRAGLQLLARVVLPRSRDPHTGQALTVTLHGTSYSDVGRWEQLRMDDIPQLVRRQIRILRAQLRVEVDEREAYLDRVMLNAYGGPGVTNVWIDDLDLAGYVPIRAAGPAPLDDRPWQPAATGRPVAGGAGQRAALAALQPGGPSAGFSGPKLVRSILTVQGGELFPRIIQYQGESPAFLRKLGFHAVWLPRLAGPQMLAEAEAVGLWIVCPPPFGPQPEVGDPQASPPPRIGSEYDRVLAWDLSMDPASQHIETIKRWADRVRRADDRGRRPIVCRADAELALLSRYADVLWMARAPQATSLELDDYGRWLSQRPLLARPGTPFWNSVQTQPSAALRGQWSVLSGGRPLPGTAPVEQIRLLAYTAVASGVRGLVFESETRLDADDPDTLARAAILEQINLELDVIEPWTAAGHFVASFAGSAQETVGTVLRTDRARLLLPIWSAPGAQYVAGQSAAHQVSFVVPGVPEAHDAFVLAGGRLRPVRRDRVAGGIRVALEEFDLTGAVVLTQDPLVISSTTRRAGAIARRTAELSRNLAAWKLMGTEATLARLPRGSLPTAQASAWLAASRAELQRCGRDLDSRDYVQAYLRAQRAMRPLRLAERTAWEAAVVRLPTPAASPAATTFRTLPWHLAMMERVGASGLGPNRLPMGDFEDLGAMMRYGWRHVQRPSKAVLAAAELVPQAARSGRLGLRLVAEPADPDSPPEVVETPPIWITSPGIRVETEELLCVRGWIRAERRIHASVDGLLILDSLGGEPLALRIDQTADWEPFELYRAAPQSGLMTVSFVLSGLGEVWLDDVEIRPVQAAAIPSVGRAASFPPPRRGLPVLR